MSSEVYYCFLPYNIVDVEIKKEKKKAKAQAIDELFFLFLF
jgi:hypothetical protein